MELPDNLLDELEILENITSCNKVGMSCIIGSQSRKAAFFRILLGDIYKWSKFQKAKTNKGRPLELLIR